METFSIFCSILTAIVIEAAPFLLLGSFLGSLIEVYVSRERMARLIPGGLAGRVATGLVAGMVLPTCECGVVPIVRRLLGKGVPPATAVAYMLAAPVINPVVLASTYVGFKGDLAAVGLRVAMVVLPAAAMGLLLGRHSPGDLLRHGELEARHSHGCECCHGHDQAEGSRLMRIMGHTASEFLTMCAFLVLGGAVASLFKVLAPASLTAAFSGSAWLSVPFMMVLAMLLSVCSEADAFVAAAFVSFPLVARVAFTAIGPMVDLKLVAMFLAVFKRRVVLFLILVPTLLVWATAMLLSLGGVR